jgi:ubiquinol-cytochrome c reductase iron-sulfur subunit
MAPTGAGPISARAPRPLPQMYLGYNDDGYLIAMAPFNQPIGPGFWERNS